MPTPNKGETQDEWMGRCMGSPESRKTFPDSKQRAAVCYSKWRRKSKSEKAGLDVPFYESENGYDYIRLSDIKDNTKREAIAEFMKGQTMPVIKLEDETVTDAIFAWDFENFLDKLIGE